MTFYDKMLINKLRCLKGMFQRLKMKINEIHCLKMKSLRFGEGMKGNVFCVVSKKTLNMTI